MIWIEIWWGREQDETRKTSGMARAGSITHYIITLREGCKAESQIFFIASDEQRLVLPWKDNCTVQRHRIP